MTIDMGLMNGNHYDPETKLVSLEPGGRWGNVYAYLEKRKYCVDLLSRNTLHGRQPLECDANVYHAVGVMVAGGREGLVGVGGVLTGGGKSYYTCRAGFACGE